MIDNTFEVAAGPLYETAEEALAAPGAIYVHIKKGGIYRRIGALKYAGDLAADLLEGVSLAAYEHLWPHPHSFFARPDDEFEEIVVTDAGTHARFERHVVIALEIVSSEAVDV